MQSWAAQELQTAALGDPRRGRRLVTLVEALAAQPAANVPRACGSWAATNSAYRLWNHPHLTADALRAAPIDATRQRLRALPCVRAVQDATTLDWSHHPGATGLGPLNASGRQGMHVPSTLA
ncbi:MAG: transposase, partial [Roseiflexaceae bacterium]|nr:transposase [Roseiflexaceae bacterium]